MGCLRNNVTGGANLVIGTQAKIIGNVPQNAVEGSMHFMKVSTGDTVFNSFKNKKASASEYDVILTDQIPFFDDDGLTLGDIQAVGSATTSTLSTYIPMKIC